MSRALSFVCVMGLALGGCDMLTGGGGGADPVDVVVDVKPTPAAEDQGTPEAEAEGEGDGAQADTDAPSTDAAPDVGTADETAKATTTPKA